MINLTRKENLEFHIVEFLKLYVIAEINLHFDISKLNTRTETVSISIMIILTC